jgi:antitoxin YefM
MQIVEFSVAKDDLGSVLERVSKDADYTIITRPDSEDAVVMSLETFNSHMETMHLLKSPAYAQHLTKSIEQYKEGKVFQRELLDA